MEIILEALRLRRTGLRSAALLTLTLSSPQFCVWGGLEISNTLASRGFKHKACHLRYQSFLPGDLSLSDNKFFFRVLNGITGSIARDGVPQSDYTRQDPAEQIDLA
jgi:hypothetical protein